MRRCYWLVAAAILAICVPSDGRAAGPYILTHLGELPGNTEFVTAADINSQGHVVGQYADVGGGRQGFIWTPYTPNGSLGVIGAMHPRNAGAFGINDSRQVVGQSSSFPTGGFLWNASSPNGSTGTGFNFRDDVGTRVLANSINSFGQFAGHKITGTLSEALVFIPDPPNSFTFFFISLGHLPGGLESSAANDLNAMGQVVGWSHVGESAAASRPHAFLWKPFRPNDFLGSMFDLGDLPGGDDESIAHGINSRGQVVGEGSVASGPHAFLWSPGAPNGTSGTMIDLGELAGSGGVSSARDINGRGVVVGHSGTAGAERAFVWMPTVPNGTTGTMIDLNTMLDPMSSAGWRLKSAEAINDFGQIVGSGLFDPDGRGGSPPVERAFLLTPIPEPATIVLIVVIGLTFMPICSFRKRRPSMH